MKLIFFLLTIVVGMNSPVLAFEVPKKLKTLEDRISALNIELFCENADDCIALPVGYKACGGPQKYIVTSKKNSKLVDLKKTIEEHLTADRAWKKKQNIGSGCDSVLMPPIACQNLNCIQVVPEELFSR